MSAGADDERPSIRDNPNIDWLTLTPEDALLVYFADDPDRRALVELGRALLAEAAPDAVVAPLVRPTDLAAVKRRRRTAERRAHARELLTEGRSTTAIARELGVSPRTVYRYVRD